MRELHSEDPLLDAEGQPRDAGRSWSIGLVNASWLRAAGVYLASPTCSTVEPLNKNPVTDSRQNPNQQGNCKASYEGGPNWVSNFRSFHSGGANFVFVDGHVTFLSDSIDLDTYRALSTMADGEVVQVE